MNRIDRLTAILTHLQSKRLVKAQEIADRFEVSLRTVYRDIRALEEGGIPIIGEAGQGYSLMEGYRLPPVMFSRQEALALLMAEKLIEKITDKDTAKQIQSAMFKVKAVLRNQEKSLIDTMTEHIEIFQHNNSLHVEGKDKSLQLLVNSLAERKVVRINYTTFETEISTCRSIEPVGVYYAYEQWYLIAWCRLRKAYRTFRVDRMQEMTTLDENYDDRHPSLKAYLERVKTEQNLIEIIISVPSNMVKYLRRQAYDQGLVMKEAQGAMTEMTFMSSSQEAFLRWSLMMGDHISILKPLALKAAMEALLLKMLENVQRSKTH